MLKVWKLVHIAKNIIVLNGNERGNKMKYFKGQIELKGEYKLVDKKDYFIIYDKHDNQIYYESLLGFWTKREYDKNNNQIYYEDSDGYWSKCEYDKNNNEIYYENLKGYIVDNRPEIVMTIKEIEEKLNIVGLKIVKEETK